MMLNKLKNCPVCKDEGFQTVLKAKDYLITDELFQIVKCDNCGFIYTNPRPNENELGKYYKSSEYDSHKTKSSSLKDFLYNKVRDYSTKKKLDYITSISKGRRLLDVGCGAGFFINYCNKRNWSVEGMEPNLESIPLISKGITIHSTFSTIKENSFDIITLWHSLEHIPQLDEVLSTVKKALKNDGKIIIAVPNINSLDAKLYNEHWAALDVPRHLYHFTQSSLAHLLNNYQLKISNIHPLIFDSFYVSLLSEKYKSGTMNYFNAFKKGLKSNNWAKYNNSEYSSLMYTIEKV